LYKLIQGGNNSLFVAQGIGWTQAGGFLRRIQAEDHAHDTRKQERKTHRPRHN